VSGARSGQGMSLALAAATCAWLLLLALAGVHESLLYLAPAVLMAIPLLWGRFPAERVLVRLASRRRRRRRPTASHRASPRGRVARRPPVRGARLIAHSLAGRAPPCAAGNR
jgi:hypothetical protein